MFVRFKTADTEVNLIAANIESFRPASLDGEGSIIRMVNGNEHRVPQSNQSVRGALKKLAAPAAEQAEG